MTEAQTLSHVGDSESHVFGHCQLSKKYLQGAYRVQTTVLAGAHRALNRGGRTCLLFLFGRTFPPDSLEAQPSLLKDIQGVQCLTRKARATNFKTLFPYLNTYLQE